MARAFTLAEVLITLGIIGVVASVTLPTLINNYKNHVTVVKLKKEYNVISNALNLMKNQEDTEDLRFTKLWQSAQNFSCSPFSDVVNNYFNTQKGCKQYSFDERYFGYYTPDGYPSISTIDGADIYFSAGDEMYIYIDVNGWSGKPNQPGKDFFAYQIDKFGKIILPSIYDNEYNHDYTFDSSDPFATFGKIVNDGWQIKY